MNADLAPGVLRDHPEGCSLAIRVQPGARKTAISGLYGEGTKHMLKITLRALPIEGRANEALTTYLVDLLSVPRSAVVIAHGQSGRSKTVILRGITVALAQAKLQTALCGLNQGSI
jgi:uncharacterized protein